MKFSIPTVANSKDELLAKLRSSGFDLTPVGTSGNFSLESFPLTFLYKNLLFKLMNNRGGWKSFKIHCHDNTADIEVDFSPVGAIAITSLMAIFTNGLFIYAKNSKGEILNLQEWLFYICSISSVVIVFFFVYFFIAYLWQKTIYKQVLSDLLM